jgi:hypothetical protein
MQHKKLWMEHHMLTTVTSKKSNMKYQKSKLLDQMFATSKSTTRTPNNEPMQHRKTNYQSIVSYETS